MSEQIPSRKVGEKVRVMQTDEMVKAGLANKIGIVRRLISFSPYQGDECIVDFAPSDFPCSIVIYGCTLSGISK